MNQNPFSSLSFAQSNVEQPQAFPPMDPLTSSISGLQFGPQFGPQRAPQPFGGNTHTFDFGSPPRSTSSILVALLVGSHKYLTTKQTLRKIPLFSKDIDDLESKFECVELVEDGQLGTLAQKQDSFSFPQPQTQPTQKYIFVDRDGTLFEYILAFARSNGSIHSLPSKHDLNTSSSAHQTILNRLIEEAKYYGMDNLVEKCLDVLQNVSVDSSADILIEDDSFDLSNMKLLQMRHYSKYEQLLELNTTPELSATAFPIPHTELEFRVPFVGEYNPQQKSCIYFRWHIGDSDGHYYVEIDNDVRGQKIASTGFTVNNGLDERLQYQFAYRNNGNVEYCTELAPGPHKVRLFVQGFNPHVRYTIGGPVIAQVYLVQQGVVSSIATLDVAKQ